METETEVPVNFGKSIIVPSVQELAKEPIIKIPPRYVRDDQDPQTVSDDSSLPSVPVIHLERLVVEDSLSSELEKLHSACKDWGFFQVGTVMCPAKLNPEIFASKTTPKVLRSKSTAGLGLDRGTTKTLLFFMHELLFIFSSLTKK